MIRDGRWGYKQSRRLPHPRGVLSLEDPRPRLALRFAICAQHWGLPESLSAPWWRAITHAQSPRCQALRTQWVQTVAPLTPRAIEDSYRTFQRAISPAML